MVQLLSCLLTHTYCRAVHALPGLLAGVKRAKQRGREAAFGASVAFLEALPSLQTLHLYPERTLFGVHRLQGLTSLHLTASEALSLDMAPLSALPSLCRLKLFLAEDVSLSNLDSLAAVSTLTQLRLLGQAEGQLVQLPAGLPALTALLNLDLLACTEAPLSSQQCLSGLQGLTCLSVSLAGVPAARALPSLRRMGLHVDDSSALAPLTALTCLTFLLLNMKCATAHQHAEDLVFVTALSSLRVLSLLNWQAGFEGVRHSGLTTLALSHLVAGEHYLGIEACLGLAELVVEAVEDGVVIVPCMPPQHVRLCVPDNLDHVQVTLQARDILAGRVFLTAGS